jgi:hypothetical protein
MHTFEAHVRMYPPQPEGVNRRYPPPVFPIAIEPGFGNAGTERFCAGASNDQMLLRHGPDNTNPDRRAMRRFRMKLPASVRVSGIPSPFDTESENVSARGIFFYIDRWMKEGSQVEVTMDFPSQLTLSDPLRVRFLARVVRVEPLEGMRMGVAAAIEEYEFLRSAEEGSAGLQPGWSFGA